MMREILFRGQRDDTKEWVYGAFVPDALEGSNDLVSWGFIRNYNRDTRKMQMLEVDRETVGQFTGLTDKNKSKGFEGDIVTSGKSIGVIVFHDGRFIIDWIVNKDFWSDTIYVHLPVSKIIGNRWDNPELLEDV